MIQSCCRMLGFRLFERKVLLYLVKIVSLPIPCRPRMVITVMVRMCILTVVASIKVHPDTNSVVPRYSVHSHVSGSKGVIEPVHPDSTPVGVAVKDLEQEV